MERGGRGDRSGFFSMGEPFSGFRGFGIMPSLFGGRDPFDDPFFARPSFTSALDSPATPAGVDGGKGLVIEELRSDDEADYMDEDRKSDHGPRSGSSQEPSVEHPDEDSDESDGDEKDAVVNKRDQYPKSKGSEPEAGRFSFHSSKVTYGGVDGAYYTSSRTRRTGTDGTIIEERREADKAAGQATHRISRGIHDKGHSVTRKLNSDGKVDSFQTLHNLHEDELARFEEAWKGNYEAPSFGWTNQFGFRDAGYQDRATNEGWAFPSIESAMEKRSDFGARSNQSAARTKKVVRINVE